MISQYFSAILWYKTHILNQIRTETVSKVLPFIGMQPLKPGRGNVDIISWYNQFSFVNVAWNKLYDARQTVFVIYHLH